MNLDDVAVHFFVMNNLFYSKDENGDPITIHEKYDLKGSTVNRSSVPPREGDTCTCKDCKQKFVYHRKKRGRRSGADQSLSFRQGSIREPEEVDLLDSK